jgi:hypothetical protein
MKPKEMLLERLEETVVPVMRLLGFSFSRSRLLLSRRVGYARQEISFSLDKWNSENNCAFWTMWAARAPLYRKWHNDTFGEDPPNDALGGVADWNIPGWSRGPSAHATLTGNPSNDAEVAERLLNDIKSAGIPYIDQISTWESAAERLLDGHWTLDRAADFLMIAGRTERARLVLEEGIRRYSDGSHDQFGELPRLRLRRAKFFGDGATGEIGADGTG